MIDLSIQRNGQVKILLVPFVKLFLNKTHNDDCKQWDDREQNTGHVVCLTRLFILEVFVAPVKAPKNLHVLVLLSLSRIIKVVGAHLIHRCEVKHIANANHDLIQCSYRLEDGAPAVWCIYCKDDKEN